MLFALYVLFLELVLLLVGRVGFADASWSYQLEMRMSFLLPPAHAKWVDHIVLPALEPFSFSVIVRHRRLIYLIFIIWRHAP